MGCHIAREDNEGSNFGIYFESYSHQDSPYSVVSSGPNAYANIRDRVNLDAPRHSLMLEKPSNAIQHAGGLETGYGPTDVQQYYDFDISIHCIGI